MNIFKFLIITLSLIVSFYFSYFLINENNLHKNQSDIQNYKKFINNNIYNIFKKTNKIDKIIIIIDKFYGEKKWHGDMVEELLEQKIKKLKKEKIFSILKIHLTNKYNIGILSLNNKKYKINIFLFINAIRNKFISNKIAVNLSFVYPNILSDLYFIRNLNFIHIYISIASGNFSAFDIKNNSYKDYLNYKIMQFNTLCRQFIFFNFYKKYFNKKIIKFNLSIEPKSLSLTNNNVLYFYKTYPNYFLKNVNLSTSGATPLGLLDFF